LLVAIALPSSAFATILTFDITDSGSYPGSENFPEGYQISGSAPGYGDRVTSTSTSNGLLTYGYGVGTEGFTSKVEVDYGPYSIFTGGPELWRYDYGDLDRVLYQGSRYPDPDNPIGNNYNYLAIELIADAGYNALLYGFDLGGWNRTDRTIKAVTVFDGTPFPIITPTNQIYSQSNVVVEGDGNGPSRTSFVFNTPLVSSHIYILIDASNLGDDSELVGIDNIRFGQELAAEPVPEPATLTIWGLGALGCAAAAYRRRKLAA
jgi:hypothetical protein